MERRLLGATGVQVSAIGFGCQEVGGGYGDIDEREFARAVGHALDIGINLFDTAEAYGFGASEEALGRALRGRRDEAIISTKFGTGYTDRANFRDGRAERVHASIDASLRRLGTDHVDVYTVHWPDRATPFEETLGALDEVVRAGKVRFVALSNFTLDEVEACSKVRRIDVVQYVYGLFDRRMEQDLLPWCADNDVGFLGYGALAYGLLSGTLPADHAFPADDWRSKTDKWGVMSPLFEHLFGPGRIAENVAVVDDLRDLAAGARPLGGPARAPMGHRDAGRDRVARRLPVGRPRSTTTPPRSTGRSRRTIARRSTTSSPGTGWIRAAVLDRVGLDREGDMTMGELTGKVAIVTGGAGGLGKAAVERFIAEDARVVIADIDEGRGEELAAELGDTVAFQRVDVSNADDVQAAVDLAVEQFGSLDIMFNNAGVGSKFDRLIDNDLSDFDTVIGVDLKGVMLGTQRAARRMAEQGGGAIVNTASIAATTGGAGPIVYRAAKAAVVQFSKSAAIDLAPHNIRVNCIAPGHIPTGITNYDLGSVIRTMQPLQRHGSAADVAEAVLYLVSDRSAQITGIVMPIDGGTSAGPPVTQLRDLMRGVKAGDEARAARAKAAEGDAK